MSIFLPILNFKRIPSTWVQRVWCCLFVCLLVYFALIFWRLRNLYFTARIIREDFLVVAFSNFSFVLSYFSFPFWDAVTFFCSSWYCVGLTKDVVLICFHASIAIIIILIKWVIQGWCHLRYGRNLSVMTQWEVFGTLGDALQGNWETLISSFLSLLLEVNSFALPCSLAAVCYASLKQQGHQMVGWKETSKTIVKNKTFLLIELMYQEFVIITHLDKAMK